jgi:hypothetical protein
MTGSMRKKLIVLKKIVAIKMGTAYRRNADVGNLNWQLLICDPVTTFLRVEQEAQQNATSDCSA